MPTPTDINDPRLARVKAMLTQTLPRLQPKALKHTSLAAVANVLNHSSDDPLLRGRAADLGQEFHIGFGDARRTQPLLVVVDEDSQRVVHAFVPRAIASGHPDNARREQIEMTMLARLQQHENTWCANRGAQPRNIVRDIATNGRGRVARHGITGYPVGDEPFTTDDVNRFREWYVAELLDPDLHITSRDGVELDLTPGGNDIERIADNIRTSAWDNALGGATIDLDVAHKRTKKPGQVARDEIMVTAIRATRPDAGPTGPEL